MKRTAAEVDTLLSRYSEGLIWFLRREKVAERHVGPLWGSIFVSVFDALGNDSPKSSEKLDALVWTIARRQLAIHASQTADCLVDAPAGIAGMRLLDFDQAHAARVTLQELRPKDRQILVQYYLKEQTSAEICQTFQITETQFWLIKSSATGRFRQMRRKPVERASPAARTHAPNESKVA